MNLACFPTFNLQWCILSNTRTHNGVCLFLLRNTQAMKQYLNKLMSPVDFIHLHPKDISRESEDTCVSTFYPCEKQVI